MPEWSCDIEFAYIIDHVPQHDFWLRYLSLAARPSATVGIHLAIFAKPFLSLVLEGRKTVDSRLSRTRHAPFNQVREGDVILIKQAAGPICGLTLAKRTWFYELAHEPLNRIRDRFGEMICADESYWEGKRRASYATVIELAETIAINAFPCNKRDRRGWVALRPQQLALEL